MAKHPGGRPPKFTSVDEIAGKVEKYFEDCKGKPIIGDDGQPIMDKNGNVIMIHQHPPTVTGLALALGFAGRKELLAYQGKREFCNTITRAKSRIEQYAEERLFDRDGQRGAEFSLRCNFRWRQEEQTAEAQTGGIVLLPAVMQPPAPPEEPDGDAD